MPGQLVLFEVPPVDARLRARVAAAPSTPPVEPGVRQLDLFAVPLAGAMFRMTQASEKAWRLRGAALRSVERVIEAAQREVTYWSRWSRGLR